MDYNSFCDETLQMKTIQDFIKKSCRHTGRDYLRIIFSHQFLYFPYDKNTIQNYLKLGTYLIDTI